MPTNFQKMPFQDRKCIIFTFSLLVLIGFIIPVYGSSIDADKNNYGYGDKIIISGNLDSFKEGQFVGLRILDPTKSDIVAIDQFIPNGDGSFSKTYNTEGPKWSSDGKYTIELYFENQIFSVVINFISKNSLDDKNLERNQNTNDSKDNTVKLNNSTKPINIPSDNQYQLDDDQTQNPKFRVEGFPNPKKSPQYYIDRYNNESEYRKWFFSTFPEYKISEVVGYPATHITNFPDPEKPPRYYLDRYYSEDEYKKWFDSQFQDQTIFEVLGYPESIFQKIPKWIKQYAKWWSSEQITDQTFINGIEYMVQENIIFLAEIPNISEDKSQKIPNWVKNTASWWSDDLIDEDEFLKGLVFLIEKGIIKI